MAKPKASAELIRTWIQGVVEANAVLQRHVDHRGIDVPIALLKALSDLDWACRAVTVADASWHP